MWQIFVEVERARVTRILSDIKREQGDIKAAADILCELQVETFGSMSRREKTDFILEQVGLCILNNDWMQAAVISRKISTKYISRKPKKTEAELKKEETERAKAEAAKKSQLAEAKAKGKEVMEGDDNGAAVEPVDDDVTDLRLRYYEQQIILAKHEDKYLEVCKHYRQVIDTESVENNPEQLKAVG